MFKVVVDRPRRRIWTPRTVALSAGAHLLVLTAFAAYASSTPEPTLVVPIDLPPLTPRVQPAPPPAPTPRPPTPVTVGHTRVVDEVTVIPDKIPAVDPHLTRLNPDDFNGIGPGGDSVGTTTQPGAQGDSTGTGPLPSWNSDVIPAEKADVLPELANRAEAQRMLERVYPPILRDAGIAGRTMVTLIIGRDGKVEPGSVSVQESTNDAFRDAAIRAAERFRFRPAQFHGQPVAVVIALPIDWQIRN